MGDDAQIRDHQLVQQCLSGSRLAWDEFYDRFVLLVRKVIHAHMRCSEADMQDMVQNVFLAVYSALGTYDRQYPLSRFVWVIGERVCIDEYRKSVATKRFAETVSVDHHDHRDETSVLLSSDLDPPEDQVAGAELLRLLRSAFKRLGERCRELLKLRYLEELSFKEIAPLLGAKEKTLAVQAGRCLDKLKDLYSEAEREG